MVAIDLTLAGIVGIKIISIFCQINKNDNDDGGKYESDCDFEDDVFMQVII